MKDDFWKSLGVMDENLDGKTDLTDYLIEDDFEKEIALMEKEEAKKLRHSHHEDLGEEYDEEFSDDDIDDEEFFDDDMVDEEFSDDLDDCESDY